MKIGSVYGVVFRIKDVLSCENVNLNYYGCSWMISCCFVFCYEKSSNRRTTDHIWLTTL